jgi:translation initiation factor RLI1
MVERLTKERPEFFNTSKTCKSFRYFNGTSVDSLCSKLKDLIWKPLTKQDYIELVNGLGSRKKKALIEHRKSTGITSDVYDLKSINLKLNLGGNYR